MRIAYTDAYEKCKDFSRKNSLINIFDLEEFIFKLDIDNNVRIELNNILNIKTYIGNSKNL